MLGMLKKAVSRLHNDTSGAMAVEKILLLAIIALPVIIVLAIFRHNIQEWFKSWSDSLEGQNTQGATP